MRAEYELHPTNPPSVLEHMIAVAVAMLILEQHSRFPEANFVVVGLVFLVVFGLFIAYCVRIVVLLRNGAAARYRSAFWNWIVFPVVLAMMFSSAATHWPASLRFYLSKSSFDKLVAQAHRGEKLEGFPRRVGLYWIEEIKDDSFRYESRKGTIGFVTGEALVDPCGLLYDNTNADYSHYLTTRIAPGWYVTEW